MDLRDHGHCVRDLVASLPKNPMSDEIRTSAEAACRVPYENHIRSEAACETLTRGLHR